VVAAVIDCGESAMRFWSSTLSTRRARRWTDAHGNEFVQLDDPDGAAIPVLLQPGQDQGDAQPSAHLDLVPLPGNSQAAEVNRLAELGATAINDASDLPWVVLADPAGNRFCMLSPTR
jgi:glyoxalase superfamily protein